MPSRKYDYCSYAEKHPVEYVTSAVVMLGGVGAAPELPSLVDAGLWEVQMAGWELRWAINDAAEIVLAKIFTKIGMDSKIGIMLMDAFLKNAIHNPESDTMVIGSFPNYINTGEQAGYSYFSVNNPVLYGALDRSGWAQPLNDNAIYDGMSRMKTFLVDFPKLISMGEGLQNEIDILDSFHYLYELLQK